MTEHRGVICSLLEQQCRQIPQKKIFLCVEGADGTGKTTLISGVAEQFVALKNTVRVVKFPSASSLAASIMDTLAKQHEEVDISPQSLHLLFAADRWEGSRGIAQALQAGEVVLCDRYIWSGQAYSIARKLDDAWVCSSDYGNPVQPTHIVYLYGDPDNCMQRIIDREKITPCCKERPEVSVEFIRDVQRAYDEVLPPETFGTNFPTSSVHQDVISSDTYVIKLNVDSFTPESLVKVVMDFILGNN